MACSAGMGCEDWAYGPLPMRRPVRVWRLFLGFGRRSGHLVGVVAGQAAVAGVGQELHGGYWSRMSPGPSGLTAVCSCIRPGRVAPTYIGRLRASEAMVALVVFCLRL